MDKARYDELQFGSDPQALTPDEMKAGWRWCHEFDGLLTDECPFKDGGPCLCKEAE